MQYNCDFHLRHQLVDASQMLGEFESFYYIRNVHNDSWYGTPKFPSAPHLIWWIDPQISGKRFSIVLKNINFFFCTPILRKPWICVKQSRCYENFVIHHDLIYETFDS